MRAYRSRGGSRLKRIRVHSVEQYVAEIGPLMQKGLTMYRADDPENRLLGVGFEGSDTEVMISIAEFKSTGDLVRYGELIEPYEPAGKKTQKVKEEKKKEEKKKEK
jgi:hypothetical protein